MRFLSLIEFFLHSALQQSDKISPIWFSQPRLLFFHSQLQRLSDDHKIILHQSTERIIPAPTPAEMFPQPIRSNCLRTRVFHIRIEMPIMAFSSLLHENKKIQWQNVALSGNRTQAASDSKSYMLLSTLTCHLLVRTEALGSLYSHALLILLKSI